MMRSMIQSAILVPLILLLSAYGPGMPNEGANNNQHTQAGIQNHTLGETKISSNETTDEKQNAMITVNITISNEVFPAQFYDNESAQILISQMPVTLHMDDYAGQEKVTQVSYDFPSTATEEPATI